MECRGQRSERHRGGHHRGSRHHAAEPQPVVHPVYHDRWRLAPCPAPRRPPPRLDVVAQSAETRRAADRACPGVRRASGRSPARRHHQPRRGRRLARRQSRWPGRRTGTVPSTYFSRPTLASISMDCITACAIAELAYHLLSAIPGPTASMPLHGSRLLGSIYRAPALWLPSIIV
jgi:hypothetical protein